MRLTEIELANFKVFGESTKIPIRPITLVFGPNSSGKSSLIQSLLLMKQSATAEFTEGNSVLFRGSLADLGSYLEVVNGRDPSKSISIGVTLDLSDEASALEDFSKMTGLQVTEPQVSLKTNFISGQLSREGMVGSIEATFDDETLLFEAVNEKSDTSDSTSENTLRSFLQRFRATGMRISSKSSAGTFLYEEIVQPLVAKAIAKLIGKIEELREKSDATSDEDLGAHPEPIKIGETRFRFRRITKADIVKDLRSHERFLSVLSAYDNDAFRKDLELAFEKIIVGLRGCILNRLQVFDQNSDILYPDLEQDFYVEKFKELLADELFQDQGYIDGVDDPLREWGDVYTQKYFLLTHIWLLDLILISSDIYRKFLSQLLYVGPMRQFPSRYYLPESIAGDNVGKTGELSPTLFLQRPHLVSAVNTWLDRLKVDYELDVSKLVARESDFEEGVFALRIRKKSTGLSSSLVDVGFGVSQLLPVVLQCVLSEKATICVEQPEIHLHPALQAELGDLFIDAALGDQKNTFILETHSEHLILRLMRRMRDTFNGTLPPGLPRIHPKDVAVLFVQSQQSSTTVRVLELDEEGQLLDPFPGGFFEEGFRERFS